MRFLATAAANQLVLNWDAVRDTPLTGVMVYDMRDLPMKGVEQQTYNAL